MLCPQGQDPSISGVGVLTLKSEQKKVTTNMVTLNFGTFLKTTVQDGLTPVPKARLDVVNLIAKK